MLGDEDGMAAHGRLLAVIRWLRWREPFLNDPAGMLRDLVRGPEADIRLLFRPQPEPLAKGRATESAEDVIERAHAKRIAGFAQSFLLLRR